MLLALLLGLLTALVLAVVLFGRGGEPPAPEAIPVRVDDERRRLH